MSFSDSAETPIEFAGTVYPKLRLRNIALLAGKYQASQLVKIKKMLDGEKASPEVRTRVLAVNASADYSVDDVHNWSLSLGGSQEIAIESLVQGGMKREEAVAKVDLIDPVSLRDLAAEICDHPQSPRRIAKAKAEFEAKTAAERLAEAAKNANPSGGGE